MKTSRRVLAALAWWVSVPVAAPAEEFAVASVTEFAAALSQAAVNGESDTISLAAGTYVLSQALVYDSNDAGSIAIQGGADVVLDAQGLVRPLSIWARAQGAGVQVREISFLRGFVHENVGGCLFVRVQSGAVRVENCSFREGWSGSLFNSSEAGGAFLRCESSGTIVVENNRFHDNTAKGIGGGLYVVAGVDSTVVLANNVFRGNTASTQGGGVSISLISGVLRLIHNTFTGNENIGGTGYGGGAAYVQLYLDAAEAEIVNNILWGNLAATGVGHDLYVENDGDGNGMASPVRVSANILGGLDSQLDSAMTQENNADADPLLSDDLHLLEGSPCIDAGVGDIPDAPDADFEGDLRFADEAPDIGADEYVPGPVLDGGEEEIGDDETPDDGETDGDVPDPEWDGGGEEVGDGGTPDGGDTAPLDPGSAGGGGGGGGGCAHRGGRVGGAFPLLLLPGALIGLFWIRRRAFPAR